MMTANYFFDGCELEIQKYQEWSTHLENSIINIKELQLIWFCQKKWGMQQNDASPEMVDNNLVSENCIISE